METTVIKNPTGKISDFSQKGILFASNKIKERDISPKLYTALSEIPDMRFTITSATSTEEEDKELERKSKTHLEGRAIDVRYDDNGHQFIYWITQTSEGNAWAKRHGVSILPHGEGHNAHYHVQFKK